MCPPRAAVNRRMGIEISPNVRCPTRLRQFLFCPTCNRKAERAEIVKGYEYEKDQYALFTDEELEKIAPPSARTMEIQELVKLGEVDPLYFEASYFAVPEEAGAEGCPPLLKATEEPGQSAPAQPLHHQHAHTTIV